MRYLYLSCILAALAGVVLLDWRLGTGIVSGRLVRTVAVTVPVFLVFDCIGAARGWFFSSPDLNVLIVRPGIPLEEPILLTFLVLLSVSMWEGIRRAVR